MRDFFSKKWFLFSLIFLLSVVTSCGTENSSSNNIPPDKTDKISIIKDGEADFSKKDDLGDNKFYTAESKKLFTISKYENLVHSQGACSDGTYVYGIAKNAEDTEAVISKYLLADGSFVARSEVMKLGHGNDMTFDSKNNRLVVAHGQTEGKILTLVDADTLAFIEDINIEAGAGAISYNAQRDCYVISQGGKTLHFLNSNFELINSLTRSDSFGYTAQGMGSDNKYIYFPMSGYNDNILVVYDWEGNYVTKVVIPVKMESESMFWVNGKYYIAYNSNGMPICENDFIIGDTGNKDNDPV